MNRHKKMNTAAYRFLISAMNMRLQCVLVCLLLFVGICIPVYADTYSIEKAGIRFIAPPSWKLPNQDGTITALPLIKEVSPNKIFFVLLEVDGFPASEMVDSRALYDAIFTVRDQFERFGYYAPFNPAPRPDTVHGLTYVSLGGPIQHLTADFDSMAAFSLFITPTNTILGIGIVCDDVNEAFRLCDQITETVR